MLVSSIVRQTGVAEAVVPVQDLTTEVPDVNMPWLTALPTVLFDICEQA